MIEYKYNRGMQLADNLVEAIILAKLNNTTMTFFFEGVKFNVTKSDTTPRLIEYFSKEKGQTNAPRQPNTDT